MSRHAGSITQAIFTGTVCLTVSFGASAIAAGAAPPDFSPNPSAGWFAYKREFIAPPSGPGPVMQDPKYPRVSNDDYRATGKQPTFAMGDPTNPILQPWAAEKIRRQNEIVLSGKAAYSLHSSCYPVGIPAFLLMPMTRPMYFVQGPTKILMLLSSFNEIRRIFLTDKHSPNLKPSWMGESIGHYEGDTLVVDTIGLNDKTVIDGFETPHTTQLHVTERWRLVDGGRTLEVNIHVEDPGAFTTPWNAIQRYRRFEQTVANNAVANLAMLATPEEGPLQEAICSENPNSLMGLGDIPIAQDSTPDF